MESLCGGKGPCSVYPDVSIGTQPVFAFLVNWARAKGCLRASENVFANFFRFKPAQQASIQLKTYTLIEKS